MSAQQRRAPQRALAALKSASGSIKGVLCPEVVFPTLASQNLAPFSTFSSECTQEKCGHPACGQSWMWECDWLNKKAVDGSCMVKVDRFVPQTGSKKLIWKCGVVMQLRDFLAYAKLTFFKFAFNYQKNRVIVRNNECDIADLEVGAMLFTFDYRAMLELDATMMGTCTHGEKAVVFTGEVRTSPEFIENAAGDTRKKMEVRHVLMFERTQSKSKRRGPTNYAGARMHILRYL
jgi:hypothetical protein